MSVSITYKMPDGSRIVITNVDPATVNIDVVPADSYESKVVTGLPPAEPEEEDAPELFLKEAEPDPSDVMSEGFPEGGEETGPEEDPRMAMLPKPLQTRWAQEAPELGVAMDARGPTPQKRAGMGFIRGMWMTVFGAMGFGITWLVDNYSSLNLPVWIGLGLGSVAYGVKKFFWPDTLF